jgi:Tfp pilus assembly protein PilF
MPVHALLARATRSPKKMTTPSARTSIRRRVGAAAMIVTLSLALGACSSSDKPGASGSTSPADVKETTKLLNKALQEQVAGNLDQAEKDFLEVIRRDPKNKFAYYDLGLIYQTQGKNSDAENQYRLVLTIDPKFGRALYNLGILRALANDVPGAISLYRQAILADAKDANAHYNLGLLLRGQGKDDEGNKEVQIAVNIDPKLRAKAIEEGVPLTGS